MDSRSGAQRRKRIIVGGPLAPFAEGLRGDLAGQGYALDTVVDHVHLLADLSHWLSGRGLAVAELTTPMAEDFLRDRRSAGRRTGVTPRGLAPVLGYLRRLQVAPAHADVVASMPLDLLLADYKRYLVGERGLSSGTVRHYLRCAKRFLMWLPGSPAESLSVLSAGQVTDYVMGWTSAANGTAVDMVTLPALRSLLRFLHTRGLSLVRSRRRCQPGVVDPPRSACRGQPSTMTSGRSLPAAIAQARPAAATTRSC